MSYCDAAGLPFHGPYHSTEYGFPIRDDSALFERLMLEINQAGPDLREGAGEAAALDS